MTDYILCTLDNEPENCTWEQLSNKSSPGNFSHDGTEEFSNATVLTNYTSTSDVKTPHLLRQVILCFVLGLLILLTVTGNMLVIIAVIKDKSLRCVGNCLVLSLAVADLLVACLVMPFAVITEVAEEWPYGTELCDLWTCFDVLCCTASILHLLAIAGDRYLSVTNIDYIRRRSYKRAFYMISAAWAIACTVSLPPAIGWKDKDFVRRVIEDKRCLVSQDIGYQVFATFSTFYAPLTLTLFLHWRIYKVARERIRNRPGNRVTLGTQRVCAANLAPPTIEMGRTSEMSSSLHDSDSTINGSTADACAEPTPTRQAKRRKRQKSSLETKREKKAAKMLAVITGVFVICWFPFFLMALIMPFCRTCEINSIASSVLLWLGYANSTVNPIIYTIFSPDFRSAFRRLLFNERSRPRIVLNG